MHSYVFSFLFLKIKFFFIIKTVTIYIYLLRKMNKIFLTLLISILTLPTQALARIDIVPQKIIIDPRDRNSEFTILNLFNTTGKFRVDIVSYKQDKNGIYKKMEAPLDVTFDPKKIVRFSPRQFEIAPNGRQKIRLSIRKPGDLSDGEYRFHIKAIRFADSNSNEENTVNLSMNMGVTIPVVVRHGKIFNKSKLTNASYIPPQQSNKNRPEVHLEIERNGNISSIGSLDVYQKEQGQEKKIGTITNANVFTEIDKRYFQIPLTEQPNNNSNLIVRYSDGKKKGITFDEITIQP